MSKHLLLLLLLACLCVNNVKSGEAFYTESTFFQQDNDYFLHTIERGQTVYSIAAMYNVSVDDIHRLNPESKNIIRAGDKLKIPQKSGSFIYHTIQSGETLYGVSKKYQMKGEDILDVNPGLSVETFIIGKTIRIPINRVTTPIKGGNETINSSKTNSLLYQTTPIQEVKTIKVALLLPFGLKENATPRNAATNRWVEFYQGVLLALQDVKNQGISVNLQVYDIGSKTDEIPNVLKKPEMQNINLLIGGLYESQIKLISRFSKENGIPYIIPFTSKSNEPLNNPYVYQINTPQSYLYSKASLAFTSKYKNDNIIIITEEGKVDKDDFIKTLEDDLKQKRISYKKIPLDSQLSPNITSSLDRIRRNVIIPSNDSPETLSKLIVSLKVITESHPESQISLFGYPSWQVHSSDFSDDYFRLNTCFYSIFYTNPIAPEVKSFYNTYYKWYSRDIINSYPKYGILGYDTSLYFIQLISKYGSSFENHINDLPFSGIQTDFHFERINNWSGFINTNLYLVNFNSDYSITRNLVK